MGALQLPVTGVLVLDTGLGDRLQACLREAGITDDVLVVHHGGPVTAAEFDESGHTWRLEVGDTDYHARVVIATAAMIPDGVTPYRGVAVHGMPNYFFTDEAGNAMPYIVECLAAMTRSGCTRMEVRRSAQRVHGKRKTRPSRRPLRRRRRGNPVDEAFDLSSDVGVEHDVYDGPAVLSLKGGQDRDVHVRLAGHLDPIDGRYHWQGMVLDSDPADNLTATPAVTLSIGNRSAAGRIVEQTPWGNHAIAGVGPPPFAKA